MIGGSPPAGRVKGFDIHIGEPRADVADVIQPLGGQNRPAKLVELLPNPEALINAQGVDDIQGAVEVRLTPDDLLLAPARGEPAGADLAVVQIDVEVAKFFLWGEEVGAIVGVVELTIVIAQVVDWIHPGAEARAQRSSLHEGDGN